MDQLACAQKKIPQVKLFDIRIFPSERSPVEKNHKKPSVFDTRQRDCRRVAQQMREMMMMEMMMMEMMMMEMMMMR